MSQSEKNSASNSDSDIDLDEVITRFYDRYPRLSRVLSSIKANPLSGNTLRVLVRGEQEVTRDKAQVTALQSPVMWQESAPIVISHYTSYASNAFTKYWNTTLPDIQKRYGNNVRYEHHDVPSPNQSLTEYKLATTGRAIQHHCGTDAFWLWLNAIMVDGVQSITEAYDLTEQLDLDVEQDVLKDAVELDLYGDVIWNDIQSLMGRQSEEGIREIEQQLEDGKPVFAVFVNGHPVQPAYDSIVGGVEGIRASQVRNE